MTDKDISPQQLGPNTQLVRAGYDPFEYHGFLNPPVVHASTVLFPDAETMASHGQPYTYATRGTPTTDALCKAVNELEGAAGTIVVPSGLAAVTLTLLTYLSPGDHVLVVDSVYGNVRHFCDTMLARFGIETEYYDATVGSGIEALLRPNTKLIHLEAPGSNTFEMQDVPAIVAVAHRHHVVVSMDNTWATPLYFKPLAHGVDISIQASTKYPAGHSDVLLGTISTNARHWPALKKANGALGICGAPDDAYQVLRGLRTMGVRLARHYSSALEVARWLEKHSDVETTLYPPLESFVGHNIWKRDFTGASGILSFVLKSPRVDNPTKGGQVFLNALNLFGIGYSWGGPRSLALLVDLSDRKLSATLARGPLIRLQIGLEDTSDLIADLELGFRALRSLP